MRVLFQLTGDNNTLVLIVVCIMCYFSGFLLFSDKQIAINSLIYCLPFQHRSRLV